jgi:hypothetical protein
MQALHRAFLSGSSKRRRKYYAKVNGIEQRGKRLSVPDAGDETIFTADETISSFPRQTAETGVAYCLCITRRRATLLGALTRGHP